MDIRGYAAVLRARWRFVVLGLLLGAGIAGGLTAAATPQYTAGLTLFVSAREGASSLGDAYQGTLYTQSRVRSYAALVTNARVTEQVAARSDVPVSAGELASRTTVTTSPDTVLIDVAVTHPSPEAAAALVNALGRRVVEEVTELEAPPDGPPPVVVTVLDEAGVPTAPVSPRPARNLAFGLFAGLCAGIAAALLRHHLDRAVRTEEQLARLAGVAVAGQVPLEGSDRQALVTRADHGPRAEALRQLRTNLRFLRRTAGANTLLVTSAGPGEGKTSTAVGLVTSFADAGLSVALVDADLRRPRAASVLGLEGAVGLADVLLGDADLRDVLQQWRPSVLVLPSGPPPPNPSELLGLQAFSEVLGELAELVDLVVVDAPPLLPVADASVLAAQVDGVLLVVRAGATDEPAVRASVAALQKVEARLLGTVLNGTSPGRGDRYGYGYAPHGRSAAKRPRELARD